MLRWFVLSLEKFAQEKAQRRKQNDARGRGGYVEEVVRDATEMEKEVEFVFHSRAAAF